MMNGKIQKAIDDAASSARVVKLLVSYASMLEDELNQRKAGAVCLDLATLAIESNQPRAVTIRVAIEPDSDIEDPTTNEQAWSVASFSRKHKSFKDRASFIGVGWTSKLRHGTAFLLRYTEHGPPCDWSIVDGNDIDTADGILYYEGNPSDLPAGNEARRVDAANFTKLYTDWCNGYGVGYRIEIIDDTGDAVDEDSCWGFYDSDADYFRDEVAGMLRLCAQKYPTADVEYTGEAASYHAADIGRKLAVLRAADEEARAKTETAQESADTP